VLRPGHPSVRLLLVWPLLLFACSKQSPAERHYYDQHIQPVFNSFCVGNTSPCHRIDDATQTAAGNLDLSSFEGVQKRRDVLRNYGVYPQPLLLLKALPEDAVLIPYRGKLLTSEIRHVGGKPLQPSSDAFFEIKRWIDNGATRDGLASTPMARVGAGACAPRPLESPVPAVDRDTQAYRSFQSDTGPWLVRSCAFSNCHSSPQADFFLTCGETDEQRDANFLRAGSFVALGSSRVDESELLLRPLAPKAGGLDHTGGAFFNTREEDAWRQLRDWAEQYRLSPPPEPMRSAGETFFTENVMPVMLKRGCALETCHSPSGFNDFRLRPGTVGFVSPVALHRNYEAALHEFMSLDSPDVRQSRLVKKNLFIKSSLGIEHRGGALLEGPGPDSTSPCPAAYDPATATALCTLAEWHRIERQDHAAQVSPLAMGNVVTLAFVLRPADGDAAVEFDSFRGGADLRLADAAMGAGGRVEAVANSRSALGPCMGLGGRSDLDIRGPEWSADATKLAFAVREGEGGGLDLWLLENPGAAGARCRKLTSDNGRRQGPVRVHNFDPVFAPEGSLVFASTRRGSLTLKRMLPNADLYRVGPDLNFGNVDTVTVLSGSELAPAFMYNGQLTFTAEKASPSFYQLSGRRINWDLTDYHPLLGQRAQSDDTFGNARPSVGYQQATEIREGIDRNFLLILSDSGALGGGGALAVFNRSVGPFEEGRNDVPFLQAMVLPDAAASGRAGTRGVYRSPNSLPDGEILASYAANVADPARDVPRYDLVGVHPRSGARRMLLGGGASSLVEATLGFKRAGRLLFRNSPQLVFGGGAAGDGEAVVHFPDLPTLATLLDANLRRGRNVAAMDKARFLAVYDVAAPASATPDPAALMGSERVFTQRQLLGVAALESDGSLKVALPSRRPLILELQDAGRQPIFTMREEHQLGPGENISPGVPRQLFNSVCAGCHGSISGREPDIAVTADALTGATMSLSRDAPAKTLR
jgi:Hydrazine synthase alpha subunit middle domain